MGLNIKSGIYDLKKLLRKSKFITLYKTPVQWTSTWFSASHSKKNLIWLAPLIDINVANPTEFTVIESLFLAQVS